MLFPQITATRFKTRWMFSGSTSHTRHSRELKFERIMCILDRWKFLPPAIGVSSGELGEKPWTFSLVNDGCKTGCNKVKVFLHQPVVNNKKTNLEGLKYYCKYLQLSFSKGNLMFRTSSFLFLNRIYRSFFLRAPKNSLIFRVSVYQPGKGPAWRRGRCWHSHGEACYVRDAWSVGRGGIC